MYYLIIFQIFISYFKYFLSTTEEYLLSCSSVLTRDNLRACLKDVRALHREFWDLPLNHPDKLIVPGSSAKNRY